jgi:phosphatidate cytidylyltransferase
MSRRTRVMAALVMAPIAIAALLWLPTPYLAVMAAAVFLLGLWEWAAMAGLSDKVPRALYLFGNALMMMALAWGSGRGLFALKLISIAGTIWWCLVLLWLWRLDFAKSDTAFHRSLKLLAGSFSVIPAWCALAWLHGSTSNGPYWALYAVAIASVADSGAYFAGVSFGKHKLAPRISPGKTWEGVAGGFFAITLMSIAAIPLFGLSWNLLLPVLGITLVATFFSIAGDLFESLIKRHSGFKDSGDLIPGHGGLMDRIDSVLAVLPIFVIGKSWLGL